jgi:hypothetical protein
MKVAFVAVTLAIVAASTPASSQRRPRDLYTADGEIRIPSQTQLENEVFSEPRNGFSAIDSTADDQMERMDREIDRLVERGICTGC